MTELLEAAGNQTIERDGKSIARKRVVASLAWELLTTGETKLPSGQALKLAPQDWVGLYKWIYQHIDGAPRAELDITSDGERIAEPIDNERYDRAISTLTDAIREGLSGTGTGADGKVDTAE